MTPPDAACTGFHSPEARFYILRIHGDLQTDLILVGPFVLKDAAADYGATAQIACWRDDPNWHVVLLGDTYGLPVVPPGPGLKVEPGAYKRACGG